MRFPIWLALSRAVLVAAAVSAAARPGYAQPNEVRSELTAAADEAMAEETGAEQADAGGPNPLAWDPDLAIWTLIVFLILFWILKRYAWPQIAAAVDERERRIAADIAAAKEMNEQAKRLLAEHEAQLAAAAGEVRALLEEARRDAEHTRKMGEAKGQEDARAMVERAVLEINRAKDGAIHELAIKVANAATALAKDVVETQLTPEQNNKLVREALSKLAAASPSKN